MIYLASPYSDPDEQVIDARAEATALALGELLRRGLYIYSPITMCHHAQIGSTAFEFWEGFDLHMIRRADALWVLMLDGWQQSRGVTAETDFARNIGVPVRHVDPSTLEVTVSHQEMMT